MSTRSYVPATWEALVAFGRDGAWALPDGVEPVVAEMGADGDVEEYEYAALMTAADGSTRLATQLGVPGLRRVVVVVESPTAPGAGDRVQLSDVAALHLDTADRVPDSDPDDDLAWFGVQELPNLL